VRGVPARAGVPPRAVMDILGHLQISLTMNTYSHVIEQLQDAAAEQMTTLLWTGLKEAKKQGVGTCGPWLMRICRYACSGIE
jgi:hypothetical protein